MVEHISIPSVNPLSPDTPPSAPPQEELESDLDLPDGDRRIPLPTSAASFHYLLSLYDLSSDRTQYLVRAFRAHSQAASTALEHHRVVRTILQMMREAGDVQRDFGAAATELEAVPSILARARARLRTRLNLIDQGSAKALRNEYFTERDAIEGPDQLSRNREPIVLAYSILARRIDNLEGADEYLAIRDAIEELHTKVVMKLKALRQRFHPLYDLSSKRSTND